MSSDDQIREPLILDGGQDDVSRLELRNHGEAFPRVQMRSDGTIVTGDGTRAPDDPLLRASEGGASDAADVTYSGTASLLVVEFVDGWPGPFTGTYLDFTEYPLSFDLIIDGGEPQHIELTGDYGTVLDNALFEALNDVTTGATWVGVTLVGMEYTMPRLVHDNPHAGASIEIANLVNGDGETYVSGIVEGTWVMGDNVEEALDRTGKAVSTLDERVTKLEGPDKFGPVYVLSAYSGVLLNGQDVPVYGDYPNYRQFVTVEVTYGDVYGPDDSPLDPPPPMAFVVEKQVIDTDGDYPELAWEEVGRIEFNAPAGTRKTGRVSFIAEDVSEIEIGIDNESGQAIEGPRPVRLVAELGPAEGADVTVRTYLR